jgi:hypothetical protein
VNFSGASVTAIGLQALGFVMTHNNCWTNSSGATLPAGISQNDPAVDPQFVNTGSGDYSIGTNLKALGWPTAEIGGFGTTSYVDIGAAQRICAAIIAIAAKIIFRHA